MLLLSLFSALILLVTEPEPVVSVELILQTRGVRKSILVTPRQTQVNVNDQHWQQATPPKQWQAMVRMLKKMNLTSLASLPANATRSAVDAALNAHVRITTASQTYESVVYDHPNPPTALIPLVKAINTCAPPASRSALR